MDKIKPRQIVLTILIFLETKNQSAETSYFQDKIQNVHPHTDS